MLPVVVARRCTNLGRESSLFNDLPQLLPARVAPEAAHVCSTALVLRSPRSGRLEGRPQHGGQRASFEALCLSAKGALGLWSGGRRTRTPQLSFCACKLPATDLPSGPAPRGGARPA
jgi:hypothetical protein